MMPPGGGAARGDQLAVLAGLAHDLLVAPEVADDLAEAEAAGRRSGPVARRQPAPDAPRPYPRDRAAGRPGGGAGARQLRLREDLARGPPRPPISPCVAPALREVLALVREQADRAGAGARPDALRRADGRLPARHRRRRRRAGVRRLRGLPGDALPRAEALQAAPPGAAPPAGAVPRCGAGGAVPAAFGRAPGWSRRIRGSTARPTRSAAARPPTCASPPATTRRISPRR